MSADRRSILVLGAYFTDRESRIESVVDELSASSRWDVDQRWVALNGTAPVALAAVTVDDSVSGEPKFALLNRLLREVTDASRYAYVLVVDDDVGLPPGFLDGYLALVERHDLALAQPARTHGSFTDHHFVSQLPGIQARETRFVEIGPLFSMRADALPVLTPFDEVSPMGWGYDFAWPVAMARSGLRMGIVDAHPVSHDLRPPVSTYGRSAAAQQMRRFLARHASLERHEAFQIVRSYP